MACQAGKDVYVEKPICVAVEEGKKMVEAARKYKRVVQVGLWQRSNLHFQKAVQLVQDGLIGKVTYARTWNYSNIYPEGIGNPPDSEPPAGLDWDMWLGPAPKVPFNSNRFGVGDRWSTFRYFYDYANGWPGDWMVHLMDIVQWAMKVRRPARGHGAGQEVLPERQQRHARHPHDHARVPRVRCHLRKPPVQRATGWTSTVMGSSSMAPMERCSLTARDSKSSRNPAITLWNLEAREKANAKHGPTPPKCRWNAWTTGWRTTSPTCWSA